MELHALLRCYYGYFESNPRIVFAAVGKYKHGSDAYSEYTIDQRAAIRLNKCAGMERSYLLMPPNNKKTNSSMESITFTESDGCKTAI